MASEPCQYDFLINLLDPGEKKRSWTVKKSNLGGRGLFAIEPIKKGCLIFVSKALVLGPRADYRDSYCAKCYKVCDPINTCDKCLLILCSKECALTSDHAKLCAFLTNHWKPKPNREQYSETLGSALMYLHCLILEDQHLLTCLQRSTKSTPNAKEIDNLYSTYDIPDDHKMFINIVNSILKINTFRIANVSDKNIPLSGLYPLSSFLNHSCVPNTKSCFTADHVMAVYATKDIGIGEEILTCYTGLLWSTPARRCQLFKTKGFWCKCKRCKDRTEMGTKLSALKCLDKDCVGVLLPTLPTDPITEWSCNNCETKVPANRICVVQSALGSLVRTLDLDDQFHLEPLVLERLAKLIPYCSHVFVELRLRMALRMGYEGLQLKELSESRLALKQSLCRGTLRTLAALGAGDAPLRGLLLYHLHAALAEHARRSPALYDELKSEVESSIEQAYHILQGDISAPPDLELRHRYLGPGCDKPQQERFFILGS